ncbi:MAG TPA: trypsin-like peptidase domain-containing protein [Rhodocyclaceae bacterium]|nr:trypsin-like peptidase domain-containing protein [Rhodocyclaceae bacterium]
MSKKSLYEILGVEKDATAEQIFSAYQHQKEILAAEKNLEDQRNQLAFIDHAKEILINPEKRARYERQLLGDVAGPSSVIVESVASPGNSRAMIIGVVLIAVAAWGWYQHRISSPKTSLSAPLASASTDVKSEASGQDVSSNVPSEGPSEEFTQKQTSSAAMQTVTKTVVTTSYQVRSTAADAELVKKLVWSVYAVIGSVSFGTGVVVDGEHLLTNCHVLASNVRKGKIYAVNAVTKDRVEVTEVAYLDHQDACLIKAPGITGKPIVPGTLVFASSTFRTHNIGFAQGKLISSEGYFTGWMYKFGQKFLVTNNYCDHGVSGGPLVDDEARLVGLTSGGPDNKSYCLSVTIDTINSLKFENSRPLDSFPENYTSNVSRSF